MGDLYWGDNLTILRDYVRDESVDLVYLDPPFNSNRNYNVLFRENGNGSGKSESEAQIEAFTDTWHWSESAEEAFAELVHGNLVPQRVADLIAAMRSFIGSNDVMAYLVMMTLRLLELHRVMKPTASIYLHCDPTASHYLKVIMDTIWGPKNFRNEIIWKRTTSHSDAKRWSPIADTILYYTKSDQLTWNPQYVAHDEAYIRDKYRSKDPDGRRYQLDNMTSPNPRPNMMYEWKGFPSPPNGWRFSRETMTRLDAEGRIWYPADKTRRPRVKRYLDEMAGTVVGSVWTDIDPINSQAAERLGYPTQKPEALLERIVKASSNEGDVVLDPFCGCGTAIAVAERLNRTWLGIDITHLAIAAIVNRMESAFPGIEIRRHGEPADLAGAEALAQLNRYDFQNWALTLIKARPIAEDGQGKSKKGADRGIDGVVSFLGADRKTPHR
ncbi:MAG: site-specific DNA-methyltransferase, partial [Thermomicrobiales bacterium]